MQAAIAAHGLTKTYRTGPVVSGVHFSARPGEVIGFMGPPGSGKSTLLKLLATRIPATHGSLVVGGTPIPSYWPSSRALARARRSLGMLLEDVPLAGDLTGWENAWMLGRLYRVTPGELTHRLRTLFAWARLDGVAHRPARTFSYPLRRKLGLIQAMLHNPDVLLLDEPFHGLEADDRIALHELLLHTRQRGAALVLALSNPADARSLCTRLIMMDAGKIVADGPPGDLLQSLGTWSAIEVKLGGTLAQLDLQPVPGLLGQPQYSCGCLRVRVQDPEMALAPLIACLVRTGARIFSVDVRAPHRGSRP